MKIIDSFIFYNELDMLTYRLNILDKVVAQVRYCIGVTNTNDLENTNIKNGVFQLSVGYKF